MFGKNEKTTRESDTNASSSNVSAKSSSSKEIKTLIGEGCKVEGNFFIPNATRIDGIIKGDLTGDSPVLIGANGRIEGHITAAEAVIYGTVIGNIDTMRLELKKGCVVNGDISVTNLVSEQGTTFNGRCTMKQIEADNVTELKMNEGV
jgi:cytoskeletal protein CcmA (bactofilin family)